MALTVQQILDEVKLLTPVSSDISDSQLLIRANQVQRKLFRELMLPDKMYRFTSSLTSAFYDLPSDCSEDRIKTVLVDGQNYQKVSNQEETPPLLFCTVVLNKLYLHPNPTNEVDIVIYYRPRYAELTTGGLDAYPDLPEDFHELLVFGISQWVASTQRDVDMVNNMQAEYDALLQSAKQYFRPIAPKRITIKEKW